MFALANPNLPTTGYPGGFTGVPSFTLYDPSKGRGLASLATVSAQSSIPGTAQQPPTAIVVAPTTSIGGGQYTVTGLGSTPVLAISSGGQTFTPATSPTTPQPGQFIFDPYQGTAALYSSNPLGGSVQVITLSTATIQNRNHIPPPYPDWFYRIPVGTDITYSLGVEQQAQGSITLEADNRNIDAIKHAFRDYTKIDMFGVGFAVTNSQYDQGLLSQSPGGDYKVSVTLGGSCEYELEEPVFLYGGDATNGNPAWEKPQAKVYSSVAGTSIVPAGSPTKQITLNGLAGQQGIKTATPQILIDIPYNSPLDTTVSLNDEFSTARARPLGCFLEYWEPDTLRMRGINDVPTWVITDDDLQDRSTLTYQGKAKPQKLTSANLMPPQPIAGDLPTTITLPIPLTATPESADLLGDVIKYPKVEVTGNFTEKPTEDDAELTKGASINLTVTKSASPKRYELKKGDLLPDQPPANSTTIKDIGLNYDASGTTKSLETEIYEDDAAVARTTQIYGITVLGNSIKAVLATTGSGSLYGINGSPAAHWFEVRRESSENLYDAKTGHQTGIDVFGWESRRYITETSKLETIQLEAQAASSSSLAARNTAARKLSLYQFSQDPLTGATRYLLKPFGEFYKDAKLDGGGDYPRFVQVESTSQTSFNFTESPDPPSKLPNGTQVKSAALTKGRETFTRREIQIINDDLYLEFISEYSAEGSQFNQCAEKTSFTEHKGRPPEAPRRPGNRPITQQLPANNGENQGTAFNYYLLTPPYTVNSPTGGSTSYEFAETKAEALTAAKTDAVINAVKSAVRSLTVTVPYNGLIRPLHRVIATVNGVIYPSRVNSVANKVKVVGIVDGRLYVEGMTTLTLSPDPDPSIVTLDKKLKPTTASQQDPSQAAINLRVFSRGYDIGGVLTNNLLTRRSF